METFKKVGKVVGIILLILVILTGIGLDVTYIYIKNFAPQKMTSTTTNFGELQTASGQKKNIIEVEYFSNANKNGLECFNIKLNYFTDENREHIYSQGIQYVADSPEDDLDFLSFDEISLPEGYTGQGTDNFTDYMDKNYADNEDFSNSILNSQRIFMWEGLHYALFYNTHITEKSSRYEYQSMDDFGTLNSTNPITEDSYFTLNFGEDEDLVYMQFRGDDYVKFYNDHYESEIDSVGYFSCNAWGGRGQPFPVVERVAYCTFYNNLNIDYLSGMIFDSIQTLPAGTNANYVFEFNEDLFRYFKNTGNGVGEELDTQDRDLVINKLKSYYSISVKISADGAKSAKDTIFKTLHGSSNYNLNGQVSEDGKYSAGQTVINLTWRDFTFLNIRDNFYTIRLKYDVKEKLLQYKDSIQISIMIDQNELSEQNIIYCGLSENSGLEDFKILNIQVLEGGV